REPIVAEFLGGDCELPQIQRDAIARRFAFCGPADFARPDGFAVIQPPHILLHFPDRPSRLFDLDEDRSESQDVSRQRADVTAALEQTIRKVVATGAPKQAPRATVDAATEEKLRALGYLGGHQ